MDVLTSQIVIFGAAGDLAKRKLIPALFELHKKDLLPKGLLITGTSRRSLHNETWIEPLGYYP